MPALHQNRTTNLLSTVACGALLLGVAPVLAGQVTLTREGTNASLAGNLIAYDGDLYVVDTGYGMIGVAGTDINCDGPGCPTALPINIASASSGTGIVFADEVLVTDGTGKLSVAGRLVALDAGIYTIETVIGQININAEGTVCTGPGCPAGGATTPPASAVQVASVTGTTTAAAAPAPAPVAPAEPALIALAEVGDQPDVRVAGEASLLRRVLPALAQDYAASKNLSVSVDTGTLVPIAVAAETDTPAGSIAATLGEAGTGLRVLGTMTGSAAEADDALIIGTADIAFMTTGANPEADDLEGGILMGVDALVGLVSPENPVQDLSLASLTGILSGEITNWSELGGDDLAIRVIGFPEGHDLANPLGTADRVAQTIVADAPGAADLVTQDPAAIALVDLGSAGAAKVLGLRNACDIVVRPDVAALKTRRYPLERLVVARAIGSDPLSGHLALSAQSTARTAGLTDLALERLPMTADRDALDRILSNVTDADARFRATLARDLMGETFRLSTILKVDPETGALDPRSLAGLDDLVAFLGTTGAGDVLLAGFSTNETNAQAESAAAASAVQEALEANDPDAVLAPLLLRAAGFGSILPGSCNTDGESWVEIWLRG